MDSEMVDARATALAALPFRPAGVKRGAFTGTIQSIRDIVDHRELLGLLVRREIKSRYKDSVLGFFWSFMRPLTQLLIYYVVIGHFLQAARGIPDFAIYVFGGLTIWQLFSEIVSAGTGSIIANSGLIKKIYLPRELFPISAVGSALFNFLIQLMLLIAATFMVGKPPPVSWQWLYLPASVLLIVIFATALALLLSAINVYLRDVQYLVEVVLMVLMWASPIVYSFGMVSNVLSERWPWLLDIYASNPITLAVFGFQQTFWMAGQGQPIPADLGLRMGIAILISLVLLWVCQRVFSRLQANFAQEL